MAAGGGRVAGSSAGELRPLTEKIPALLGFDEIVGSSPDFRAALAIAAKAARARVPVLVEGESGVGKEVIAEAIHAASPRGKEADGRRQLRCGAGQFWSSRSCSGMNRGAFTGAFERKIGRFVEADGGTLFLDEIDEMPLDAQRKLLAVLQTNEVMPLGGRHPARSRRAGDRRQQQAGCSTRSTPVGFARICFYRLNVVPVIIPPLRDRAGDIPALARAPAAADRTATGPASARHHRRGAGTARALRLAGQRPPAAERFVPRRRAV